MTEGDLLPQSSSQQDQERHSFFRLAGLVPPSKFLLREETGGDFGTDRILELKLPDGQVTNTRVHVQGKSAKALLPNKDGSFSYGVPLKTVHYLRRQPCSFVFLYLEDQDRFLWAWVADMQIALRGQHERAQARAGKKDKKKKKKAPASEPSFTYRFGRVLDQVAFDEIHARALSQGIVVERIAEVFARRGKDSQAVVDFATNEVTDVAELVAFVRDHGYGLASTGRSHLIDEAIAKLPGRARDDTDIRPILAFSKLLQGEASEALALTSRVPVNETPPQRQERTMVRAAAQHALGIVTKAQYVESMRFARAQAADTVFALQIEVLELREATFESQGERLGESLLRLREICAKLEARADVDESTKLSVRLVVWDMEAFQIRRDEGQLLAWTVAGRGIRVDRNQAARMAASAAMDMNTIVRRRAAWVEQGRDLRARVEEANNVLFAARMDLSTATAFTQVVAAQEEPTAKDLETARALEQQLRSTKERLTQDESLDVIARLEMVRADVLAVLGDTAGERSGHLAARELARRVGSQWLEDRANEALEGKGALAIIRATYGALRVRQPDEGNAAHSTPEERNRLAALLVKTQGLPAARLPLVRKAVEVEHVMAREALTWCRHLGRLEATDHLSTRATSFSIDPDRWCTCAAHGHESQLPHPDLDVVLAAFKLAYCRSCPSREPAVNSPSG